MTWKERERAKAMIKTGGKKRFELQACEQNDEIREVERDGEDDK